ncbi:MAG: hypothetical protein COS94_04080 [Candidatus Hydrogenedentes bacterium CG07_land_8_20_14_0_80_42_17]|nr:MAG: hypothetical protein COS94_04080 [Candidatus Hydrogenedentes bacterium CG07_land_8_20_14_0_80_42_17]
MKIKIGFILLTVTIFIQIGLNQIALAQERNLDDAFADIQSSSDFPTIRESITYNSFDWENNRENTKIMQVKDAEPFLTPEFDTLILKLPARIEPALPNYSILENLSNVENLKDFRSLSNEQKALLSKNNFVATFSTRPQMYYFYEENVYNNIPNFVTTDIVLHTYSDLFSYLMRRIERRIIYGWVKIISSVMCEESYRQYKSATDPKIKSAALENVVFFSVPDALLRRTLNKCPAEAKTRVKYLFDKIKSQEGEEYGVDFAEFKPRGYYTQSEDWKNYFRAMSWYALKRFPLNPKGDLTSDSSLNAQLMTTALQSAKYRGIPAKEIWDRIDELINIFTGTSNYITPIQFQKLMKEFYGESFNLSTMTNIETDRHFHSLMTRLPESRIVHELAPPRQFSFFGKRFVYDTLIMQKLVMWQDRLLASGTDVMAVFDFPLARRITEPLTKEWDWFSENYNELTRMTRETKDTEWSKGIYPATLWMLSSLATDNAKPYPLFMKNEAWEAKSLNTALGSWAELRHNTILYSEAFSAEGGGEVLEVSLPKGYVEPNDLFFGRMEYLARKISNELSRFGCLTERAKKKLELFNEIVAKCRKIVLKELSNEPRTKDEYEFIHFIGGKFSQITTGCILNDQYGEEYDLNDKWKQLPEGKKNQAVIADVGRSTREALEVGIGPAHEIFVIVPTPKGGRLTRGAVYQYYEFAIPNSNLLMDEEWRNLLSSDIKPDVPIWCKPYLNRESRKFEGGIAKPDGGWFEYRFDSD